MLKEGSQIHRRRAQIQTKRKIISQRQILSNFFIISHIFHYSFPRLLFYLFISSKQVVFLEKRCLEQRFFLCIYGHINEDYWHC
mgnify:CR=1 FL=1